MTLTELLRLHRLKEQMNQNNEILCSLREKAVPSVQKLDGMPHATGVSDKVGFLAVEIADLASCNEKLQEKIANEERKLDDYIRTIPDARLRTIFRLRFKTSMSWAEVAYYLGKTYSEDSVKKLVYGYLKRTKGYK